MMIIMMIVVAVVTIMVVAMPFVSYLSVMIAIRYGTA